MSFTSNIFHLIIIGNIYGIYFSNVGKAHVSQVAEKISKLACGNTRSDRLGNIEAAAYGMDVVLNAANTELKKAYTACQDLKNVLLATDFKLDTAVTTTMSLAKSKYMILIFE